MNVALFVPCYMDLLYPEAGMATLRLLEKLGCVVEYPRDQTCCGQPMANTGCAGDAKATAEHFVKTFDGHDAVVCPSGSCTSMIRNHYGDLVGDHPVRERVFELCEFMVDQLKVTELPPVRFPHRVGIHQACHGLRELRLGRASERMVEPFSKLRFLLGMVEDIEIVELARPDECCGFGGTFAVNEEALSCQMGRDRVADHRQAGAEYIVSADQSCLMHMGGLIQRDNLPIKTLHIAQVLDGMTLNP